MGIKIGTVAKMTQLSPSGIRFLEEQGIIHPSEGRKGAYRSYTMEDVCSLLEYQNYRKCGLSIEEIRMLMEHDNPEACAEIFDRQCDELESTIRETLRLLHFMRKRKQSMELIAQKECFCEITNRPAIIWTPLKLENGDYSGWPGNIGFEIPYADSVLLYDCASLTGEAEQVPSQCGIGMYEADILNISFLGKSSVEYFEKHEALHCIVNVETDFSISGEELHLLREKIQQKIKQEGYTLAQARPVISKRILSTKRNGCIQRYDHLWIDVEKSESI